MQQNNSSTQASNKETDLNQSVHELGNVSKKLAQDAFHKLEQDASYYYEKGLKEAKNIEQKIETSIRENPSKSLFIAAGVGLLVWALWNRK